MSRVNVNISPGIFNKSFFKFLEDITYEQVFFGGSSSGKSRFLSQRAIYDLLKGGRNYLGVRNVSNTLRASVYNELKKVIYSWGVGDLFTINKSEMTITCKNGYQIILKGLDDVEKIKSITPERGVLTDVWAEEATEMKEADIKQLKKRLRGDAKGVKKRFTYSFNPILKSHWIYKTLFSGWDEGENVLRKGDLFIFKSTYKDNQFLDKQDIELLENETDEYYYNVYTLGNWGILGDVIFRNVESVDILNDPIYKTFDVIKNGLDFGYSNDPTAFNQSYYHKATKTIYIFQELHEFGLTNDQIAEQLKPIIGKEPVVCDSAEPKSIQELKNLGIRAVPARKGKDSIIHGIQWLQQQNIKIDKTLQATKNEFDIYHWKKNKDGEVTNQPVDKDNHHIDGLRYAYEDEMIPPKTVRPRVRAV
jgi:phage terminase large subunit